MLYQNYQSKRIAFWDRIAVNYRTNIFSRSYHRRLSEVYTNLISPGSVVLELGSGNGDLLSDLKPGIGIGVDFSAEQIKVAQERHPDLQFIQGDAHNLQEVLPSELFDYVILSDLVNDLWDIQTVLRNVSPFCTNRTRIIINYYSHLWQPVLSAANFFGLAKPTLLQNWLTKMDLINLLNLAGFESIKTWVEMLLPLPIPGINQVFNKVLVKFWPFNMFALANFLVARLQPVPKSKDYHVSVIVPARNEAGNIENILSRVPDMGLGTEIVFVEGNSTDNTYETIETLLPKYQNRKISLHRQDGKGKGDAVRKGFALASGDILMILDADLTVPPEDLPRFYEALAENKGEFINGVRLMYPMEKEAMRFLNFLGNKFFSLTFSYLLGQSVKDTLCGTKALFRRDYELIATNRSYFGDFDPFGDFDLLFGATRLGLKIVDLPIRYQERTYGTTNIQRWKHGWLLLKMVVFAARRIKYV